MNDDSDFNEDEFSDSSSSTSNSSNSDHEENDIEENINIEEAEDTFDSDKDDDIDSKKDSDLDSDKNDDDDDDGDDVSFFDEKDESDSDSDADKKSVEGEDEDGEEASKLSKTSKNVVSLSLSANSFLDSSDEESDDDANYLQKFTKEVNIKYIEEMHPESIIHNYEEVMMLCNVVRNKDNIIIDDLHRTLPFLTKFERARVLGQRAKQIENGAKPFVQVPENIVDAYVIAEMELKQKRVPFIIRRPIPGGKCEYWHLKDLDQVCF